MAPKSDNSTFFVSCTDLSESFLITLRSYYGSPSTAKAAEWMMASVFLILLMAVSGRIITREVDVFQAMEMRSVIAFFMLLPLVYREGGIRAMRTSILPRHIGRNVATLCRTICLVNWLDADPVGSGHLNRIHRAYLGCLSGCHIPGRATDMANDPFWLSGRRVDRASRCCAP